MHCTQSSDNAWNAGVIGTSKIYSSKDLWEIIYTWEKLEDAEATAEIIPENIYKMYKNTLGVSASSRSIGWFWRPTSCIITLPNPSIRIESLIAYFEML